MKKCIIGLLVCVLCLSVGAMAEGNNCSHANTYEYMAGMIYEQWSSANHQVLYEVNVVCEDCNAWLDMYPEGFLQAHEFQNNKCVYCGFSKSDVPSYEELQAAAQKRVTENGEGIPGKTAVVIHNGNLRAAASKDSADLGAVITDDEYEIVSYQISADNTVWLEIKYLDGTAWISASLAKISGDAALYDYAEFYVDRTCKIKVSSGRGRIAPGTKSPVIAYVKFNEKYTILDCQPASDDTLWFKIKVDGTECWISSSLAEIY